MVFCMRFVSENVLLAAEVWARSSNFPLASSEYSISIEVYCVQQIDALFGATLLQLAIAAFAWCSVQ